MSLISSSSPSTGLYVEGVRYNTEDSAAGSLYTPRGIFPTIYIPEMQLNITDRTASRGYKVSGVTEHTLTKNYTPGSNEYKNAAKEEKVLITREVATAVSDLVDEKTDLDAQITALETRKRIINAEIAFIAKNLFNRPQ